MNITRRVLSGAMASVALLASMGLSPALAQDAPIRVAMGDIASVESLGLLVAMERTKERGVPMELTFFNSEDVATQAVVGGQADIGVGAPYAFIQNSNAPIRMFYRMTTLLFFPVVNSEVYSSWQDLDGEEMTVHSRGSGTEALMRLMEQVEGIEFSNLSFVPGAEVRAGALLQGTIDATIVDAASMRLLETEAPGKFVQLPVEGVNATDEALYANVNFLESRSEDLSVFVEELIGTWEDINENPEQVVEWREQYDLLPDLPEQATGDISAFYTEAVEGGVLPLGGGSPEDAMDDLEFLAAAGQVEDPGEDVDVSMYWDFTALEAANQ